MNSEEARVEWNEKTSSYVDSINTFVERGKSVGWDKAGDEPVEPDRSHLIDFVISALKQHNASGSDKDLKDIWYPAHAAFISLLEESSQSLPMLSYLPDDSILIRVGGTYQEGNVYRIIDKEIHLIDEYDFFGHCPNKVYYAFSNVKGITIKKGWNGPVSATMQWPKGNEDIPAKYNIKPYENPPSPTQLIPFPCGRKVLLVCSEGIFVLSENNVSRLLPERETMLEFLQDDFEEDPEDLSVCDLSMEHGAISNDGKLIAVGSQCSNHLIFNDKLEQVCDIGPQSSYPHYAIFSEDNSKVAFNSCHFYNGATICANIKDHPNLETEPYEEDDRAPEIDQNCRVYAGISVGNDFIVGDAHGYIHCISNDGTHKWQHFIGSSIGSIDISHDKTKLAVSTYAGFLSIIELNSDRQRPYQIGNANNYELSRWIFWKNLPKPLQW